MNNTATRTQTGSISIGPFQTESGKTIADVTMAYERSGPAGAPVVIVCHALTGNHLAIGTEANPGWWRGLIGSDKPIDTDHYQVLTFNVLGGCDGSTGPASTNPETGSAYACGFPPITIRDMVHAQHRALKKLGITEAEAVIGGSLGGMQVLEWGLLYPEFMEKLIVLAATPVFSDYGIAFNHIASTAIRQDPNWQSGNYHAVNGLMVARMVGMVTYRSPALFKARFNRKQTDDTFDVSSYLDYQGKKLTSRFDPNSYLALLEAMNHHNIGNGRGGWKQAAKQLRQPTLVLSFDKDLIYEPAVIQTFSKELPCSFYHHIQTDFGHDGFLTEFDKWGALISSFLKSHTVAIN
ncbi:homoserine O-acetyltransferase [Lentibacillus lipolyticus]|nr:homoserine O-acetyltransferase [Lentibacillus lipolyticus]